MTDAPEPIILYVDKAHSPDSPDALAVRKLIDRLVREGRKADIDLRPDLPLKQYATLAEFEEQA